MVVHTRRRRRWLPAVLSIVPILGLTAAQAGAADSKENVLPPSNAAAASAQPTSKADAHRKELLQRYKVAGRVALIEFGSVGDTQSDRGLNEMVWLHKRNAIANLAYLRVEGSKDQAAVDAYYKAKDVKFPVHRDADSSAAGAFAAKATPSFAIVGKFGRVRSLTGRLDRRLEDWIEWLQAEKEDPGADVPLLGTVEPDATRLLARTRLPELSGQTRSLDQFIGPQGMLAVFVDTSCPFAGKALGDVPTVSATLAGQKVNTVVVNMDGSAEAVKKHYAGRQVGAPVLYDVTAATKLYWDVRSIPMAVFVGPDKKITYSGMAVWDQVAKAIEKARNLPAGTIKFSVRGTSYG